MTCDMVMDLFSENMCKKSFPLKKLRRAHQYRNPSNIETAERIIQRLW